LVFGNCLLLGKKQQQKLLTEFSLIPYHNGCIRRADIGERGGGANDEEECNLELLQSAQ
jgi:hypothetical protein